MPWQLKIVRAALLQHVANLFARPDAVRTDDRRRKELSDLLIADPGASVLDAEGPSLLDPGPQGFFINLAGLIRS
jgi:hypothetical protein